MSVGLGLVLSAWKGRALPAAIAGLGWSGLASALVVAFSNIAFVAAMSRTTVANTLLIFAAMPLFSAVLSRLFIGESVRRTTWLAIVIAIAGIVLIVGGGRYGGLGQGSLQGDMLALLAAFLVASNLVILRRFPHIDAMVVLALAGVLGTAICWPYADLAGIEPRSVAILVVLGGVIIPLSLSLFFRGVLYLPAAEVALFSLIETVLGPVWAWIGVGEAPGWPALAGGAVVIGAIVLNARAGFRRSAD
jgi:drug/metabolite transporter (DMT)-like permease